MKLVPPPHKSLALLILIVMTALGCQRPRSETSEPGTMVVVPTLRATWLRNFNPFFEPQSRWPTVAGIYEPLVVFNRTQGKFVPWLAESWYFTDQNHRLVFRLQPGVRWGDGKPFLASDVVFTLELMRRFPALDQMSLWKHIDRVEAHGNEVHFIFRYPFTLPALTLLERQPIVPEHIWKDIPDPVRFANPDPIATGPYNKILSFSPQVYVLGKNPDYWQPGRPAVDKIRVPSLGGNEAQALAILHGEVDWGAAFLPAIERIFVAKDPEHRGYFFPSLEGTVMLYANTQRAPFGDSELRKAMSMAIDRKRIVQIALQGYTRAADATGLSDLYKPYHDRSLFQEELDWTVYDPGRASAWLDRLGYRMGPDGFRTRPNGEKLHVDLNCVVGWSDWIIAAQIVVRNLRAVGLDVTLRTYEFNAWFRRLQTGDFMLSMSWSDGAAAPWSFYQRLMSSDTVRPLGVPAENNWHRFQSAHADALLADFAGSSDPKERYQIARELQREFIRTAPAIPLFPGPTWGEFNSTRIVGFPTAQDPYAPLAPYKSPGLLLVLTQVHPRGTPAPPGVPGGGAPGRGEIPAPVEATKEATP